MLIKTLFIEDNPHKRARITDFLISLPYDLEIIEAYSFTSGSQQIELSNFDIIFADISLPTYDKREKESGGRFRPFAGREIGRKIIRRGSFEKILFITQYESFSDKGTSFSFEELKQVLKFECGHNFLGMIFYDSSMSVWKDEIEASLKAFIK